MGTETSNISIKVFDIKLPVEVLEENGSYVIVKCQACGNPFHQKKFFMERNKSHTCSSNCRKQLPIIRKRYLREEIKRQKAKREAEARLEKFTVKCLNCGKEFIRHSKAHQTKTCSDKCSHTYALKVRKEKYNSDEAFKQKQAERKKEWYSRERGTVLAKERERYANDVRGRRTKRRMRNKRLRIGLLIKAETMNTPLYGQKSLWDGRDEWSRETDRCLECATNIYKHDSNGVCMSCVEKARWETMDPEKKKLKLLQRRQKYHEEKETMSKKKEESQKFIQKAMDGKIEVTDKVRNLLNNLDNDSDFSMMVNRNKQSYENYS